MEKKKRLAEMRCRLLSLNLDLDLSLPTALKIGEIIQHTAPEWDHEAREAKAEELLNLLADCKNEAEVLKKLEAARM